MQVCDGIQDCPQTETTGGGEDEEGEECGSGGGELFFQNYIFLQKKHCILRF